MTPKESLINQLEKKQMRIIVGKVRTIKPGKLNKMSKVKLLPIVESLSMNQIKSLLKD